MPKTLRSTALVLTISRNEVLNDLMQQDNVLILESIIRAARSTLSAGGQVVFHNTYSAEPDTPPDDVGTVRTPDEFEQWLAETNQGRQALGHVALGAE